VCLHWVRYEYTHAYFSGCLGKGVVSLDARVRLRDHTVAIMDVRGKKTATVDIEIKCQQVDQSEQMELFFSPNFSSTHTFTQTT